MESRISVVVPTYNRAERLVHVVEPLLADPAVGEVVVVVDGSTDDTVSRLERLAARDSRVRALVLPNGGVAAARQTGIAAARNDVVLVLDDDVVPHPLLASGHLAEHVREPGRVVLGSMPTAPIVERRPDDVTTLLYAKAYEHATSAYLEHPDRILEKFWTGNVSFPRRLALDVGMTPPDGPQLATLEDHDLGLRLRAAGARAAYVPALTATHLHRRTLPQFVRDSRRQGAAFQEMHLRHPEDVPAPTGTWIAGKLPGPAARLVDGSYRSEGVARRAIGLAGAAVRTAGALRWWRAQDVAIVVLQRVAQADGARAWSADRA